ncbi:MAG: uracil-DNA glycosylase [Bacteroidota bacterium]
MNASNISIDPSWKAVLKEEFSTPYFAKLKEFLVEEKKQFTVYPAGNRIFAAFDQTPFDKLKAVIIGQDPYHGPGQANGLSFSVNDEVKKPPSLVNIFKEIQTDLGIPIPVSGNLGPWANQGILLLNATLTVRANHPGSHQKKGWEQFTDAVIRKISDEKKGIVFLLWGKYAETKEVLINTEKHFVLKAAHPSPLAGGKFFGCKHFSKTNKLLEHNLIQPIDWRIEK